MVSCLILLAGFCFSGSHLQIEMQNFGLGYTVSVKAEGYSASFGGTDVISIHDYRKAPKACSGETCVRYFKYCSTGPDGAVRCRYAMAWPGLIADGGITVTASNAAAMAIAETEIDLLAQPSGKGGRIPLARMTVAAAAGNLPPCPDALTAADCVPP